jgi:hypothetical protein
MVWAEAMLVHAARAAMASVREAVIMGALRVWFVNA